MKKQLIFKIRKGEAIIEVQVGKHEPSEIGRLVNFRYPDIMLDCLKVFYNQHRDWLSDGEEDKDDLNPERFVATRNMADLLHLHGEEAQTVPKSSFSPVIPSPKQRIKFKDWTPVGKSRMGRIYKEVVDRMLEAYKEGEPKTEDLSGIVREMYGEHLKESSLASYVSVYRRYIRENKLAVELPVKESKSEDIRKSVVKHSQIEYNPKGKYLLPIEKVVEIWDLLPDEFEYKQVKALVPAYIMQSGSRIDTAKFIIKQFLEIAEFGCEKTESGVFKKVRLETKE